MSIFYHALMQSLTSAFAFCSSSFSLVGIKIFDLLFPARDTQVLVRNADFPALLRFYKPSIVKIQNLSIVFVLPYHSPLVQAFIIEAKFHRNLKAQEFLGRILANYISNQKRFLSEEKADSNVMIVPLPIGKKRRKERGYNQIEEVARFAQKALLIPEIILTSDLLIRTRETDPQTTLGRNLRIQNMKGAFKVSQTLEPSMNYMLLDDVVTTGATLLAAYEALGKAGARNIFTLAIAH